MPKNPLIVDQVILRNGGVIETEDGTDIVAVSSAGSVTLTGTETVIASEIALANTKLLVGNASGVAADVSMSGDGTLANDGTFAIAADAVVETDVADSDGTSGLYVKKTALATYDFAADGGAQGAIVLADVVTLPDNAVCTAVTYDVITTCISAGADAGTIALTLPTDGALTTAIAISDGTNPWDAGVHLASVITPLAVKTTAARAIGITVAGGNDLTAGKIVFAVDYYVSQ